jgi:hypothetical protein
MPRDAAIPPNSDFSALLAAFNDAGVEYLLIGGRAYSFHDQPSFLVAVEAQGRLRAA